MLSTKRGSCINLTKLYHKSKIVSIAFYKDSSLEKRNGNAVAGCLRIFRKEGEKVKSAEATTFPELCEP